MLTHRTNVLLTEEDNQLLIFMATRYNTTKGDLIRRAVRKTYQVHKKVAKSLHPLDEIRRIVKKYRIKDLTLQELMEYRHAGHRY